jgi:hypothetical protein
VGISNQCRRLLGHAAIYLLTAIAICSCKFPLGFGPNTGEPAHLKKVYVPFVESVDVPNNVKAGETFNIHIKVSAQANPGVLSSLPLRVDEYGDSIPQPQYGINYSGHVYHLYLSTIGASNPSADGDEITISSFYPDKGRYYIYVGGTLDRSSGGSIFQVPATSEQVFLNSLDLAQFRFLEFAIDVT